MDETADTARETSPPTVRFPAAATSQAAAGMARSALQSHFAAPHLRQEPGRSRGTGRGLTSPTSPWNLPTWPLRTRSLDFLPHPRVSLDGAKAAQFVPPRVAAGRDGMVRIARIERLSAWSRAALIGPRRPRRQDSRTRRQSAQAPPIKRLQVRVPPGAHTSTRRPGAPPWSYRSSGPSTGLRSTTGVPSTASSGPTRSRRPSTSSTVTRCSPIGFGRVVSGVLDPPVRAWSGRPAGGWRARPRDLCSHVRTRSSSPAAMSRMPSRTAGSMSSHASGAPA